METLIILVVAAGLSAAVVWWAMSPPDVRAQRRVSRTRVGDRPASPGAVLPEETGDGFVLLADAGPIVDDERPPAALSLLRLAVAIAVVSAIVVATVALVGLLVKLQLDQYFRTGA